jgi:hypothetical protein
MAKTSDKTSKKPTINRWCVTLGNIDSRPGHRVNCAQVKVRIYVDATSVQEAVELARAAFTGPVYVAVPGAGRLGVAIDVAEDRLRPVDVKQVTTDK